MFRVTVCTSTLTDAAEAVGELIAQALRGLSGQQPQAGVILNQGHDADSTLLAALTDTWPDMPLIGCASAAGNELRMTLLLMASPDLTFHIGLGERVPDSPAHAAEQALMAAMHHSDQVALCLTLPESLYEWSNSFAGAVRKLLPVGTPFLNELLPHSELRAFGPGERQYFGRKVLHDEVPILIASANQIAADDHSWRFTRQRGIVRKLSAEHVYEYDTLIGDRRGGRSCIA
jgi:hypothetical protein